MTSGIPKGMRKMTSTELQLSRKIRVASPQYKAKENIRRKNIRLKVLLQYSKLHSNSNIPCCACCGLNDHTDFLDIDHVHGRIQMDSIKELTDIGYSSNMGANPLSMWIMENDYPKGFQVLCKNCNQAKGMKKNNNTCPHKNKNLPPFLHYELLINMIKDNSKKKHARTWRVVQ